MINRNYNMHLHARCKVIDGIHKTENFVKLEKNYKNQLNGIGKKVSSPFLSFSSAVHLDCLDIFFSFLCRVKTRSFTENDIFKA